MQTIGVVHRDLSTDFLTSYGDNYEKLRARWGRTSSWRKHRCVVCSESSSTAYLWNISRHLISLLGCQRNSPIMLVEVTPYHTLSIGEAHSCYSVSWGFCLPEKIVLYSAFWYGHPCEKCLHQRIPFEVQCLEGNLSFLPESTAFFALLLLLSCQS